MSNISEKVNFMALRKMYTEKGNQEGLDKFVRIIFEKFSENDRKKLLAGISISQELASSLNLEKLTELLFLGAYPKSLLIESIMGVSPVFYDFESYDEIFRHHFISVDDLQKVILGAQDGILLKTSLPRWIRNVCKLFQKEDLAVYEGLDFDEVANRFVGYLSTCDESNIRDVVIFQTCCNILKKLPYNEERNLKISWKILEAASFGSNNMVLSSTLEEFLKDKTTIEVIDLLLARADLKGIFIGDGATRKVLVASVDIEELFSLMSQGKVGPVGLMLVLFRDIFERRVELINNWIANGLELPIDVYMEDIINNKTRETYKDLDKKHIGALEEEKAKQFEVKPTGQQ